MFHRKRYLCSALAAIAIAATSWSAARADTVTAKLNGVEGGTPYNTFDLHLGSGAATDSGAITGALQWTVQSVSNPSNTFGLAAGNTIDTFCIEITQNVGIGGTYTFTETPSLANAPTDMQYITNVDVPVINTGMGNTKANLLNELYNEVLEQSFFETLNKDQATAFQLAVWEIVYENSLTSGQTGNANLNLGSGSFYVNNGSNVTSAAIITQAQGWLNGLNATYLNKNNIAVFALTDQNNQDQAFSLLVTKKNVGTPLPASLGNAALLMGVFGAGYVLVKKRKALVA